MTTMTLGGYTFAWNPSEFPIPMKKRSTASVETLGGVEFYSWGHFWPGQTLTMGWKHMPTAQYTQIRTLYEADAAVTFNPGTGETFTVEILEFYGAVHIEQSGSASYRKDVQLTLLILSEDS